MINHPKMRDRVAHISKVVSSIVKGTIKNMMSGPSEKQYMKARDDKFRSEGKAYKKNPNNYTGR